MFSDTGIPLHHHIDCPLQHVAVMTTYLKDFPSYQQFSASSIATFKASLMPCVHHHLNSPVLSF